VRAVVVIIVIAPSIGGKASNESQVVIRSHYLLGPLTPNSFLDTCYSGTFLRASENPFTHARIKFAPRSLFLDDLSNINPGTTCMALSYLLPQCSPSRFQAFPFWVIIGIFIFGDVPNDLSLTI